MSEEKIVSTVPDAPAAPADPPAAANHESELLKLLTQYGVADPHVALVSLQSLGVENVDDLRVVTEDELVKAGLMKVKARNLLASLTPNSAPSSHTPQPAPSPIAPASFPQSFFLNNPLFDVPSDESYLADLKTGGILKCGRSAYVSAIRAVVANRINVRDIPKKLCTLIEEFAEANDEQVPELYWELRKQTTRRQYSEVFAAIGGSSAVTDAQRQRLIGKTKDHVFPVLLQAKQRLIDFAAAYSEAAQFTTGIAIANAVVSGTGVGALPPTMPDCAPLNDIGDELRNALNRALSGIGPAVAAAMACDYIEIRKILNNPNLPAQIGVANREQLFRRLEIDVPASLIRAESDLVRFVLAFAQNDQISSDQELGFYLNLCQIARNLDLSIFGISGTTAEPSSYTNLAGDRLRDRF